MQNGRWNGKHVPSLANKASSGRMKLQNGSAFHSGIFMRTEWAPMGIRDLSNKSKISSGHNLALDHDSIWPKLVHPPNIN